MERMNFAQRRVLVTGASSGLGAELAEQLARDHGAHLVLVARREDRLRELAGRLTSRYGAPVEIIISDLAAKDEPERVFREATLRAPLYAAILNAGVTHFGPFDEQSWDSLSNLLDLNVRANVRLVTLLLPHLEEQAAGGGVLLVASLSGLTPVAYQAAYSGTKAFLIKYGWALHHELLPRGVTVSVLAPGGIVSEMTAGERFDGLRPWLMPTSGAARAALVGFRKRKHLIVPGLVYSWGRAALLKVVPEDFLVRRVAAQYRKSLQKHRA